jgi:hypothetical protein
MRQGAGDEYRGGGCIGVRGGEEEGAGDGCVEEELDKEGVTGRTPR